MEQKYACKTRKTFGKRVKHVAIAFCFTRLPCVLATFPSCNMTPCFVFCFLMNAHQTRYTYRMWNF